MGGVAVSKAVSAQYGVPCPTCGVKAYEACRSGSGRVTDTHKDRLDLNYAASLAPCKHERVARMDSETVSCCGCGACIEQPCEHLYRRHLDVDAEICEDCGEEVIYHGIGDDDYEPLWRTA